MTKVGILEGSLRLASFSRKVGMAATGLAPNGMEMMNLPSTEAMPHYNQDVMDAGVPKGVEAMKQAVQDVDALLIVTPEYNWGIPGNLKNAIDWMSRFRPNPLESKPVAIWSVAPGLLGGARLHEGLRHVLHSQGMQIMAKPEVQIAKVPGKLDPETGNIKDEDTANFLSAHLQAFAAFCERVKA